MPSCLLHVWEQLSPPLAFETFAGWSCPWLLWQNSKWALSPSTGAGLSLAQTECDGWWSGCGCCRQTWLGATSLPSHPGDGSQRPGVGRKTVQYVNCLQSLNWQPEHAAIIILNSAMNLTHKNQGIYYDTRGRIKLWNFRSVLNIIVHILKNLVNLYDSNSVIAVPISTLGDKKWNLLLFYLPIFPWNPLNVLGHIIRRWKDKHNTAGIVRNSSELTEKFWKSVLWI